MTAGTVVKCNKCGELKPVSEFYADKKKKAGHKGHCKVCDKQMRQKPEQRERELVRVANRNALMRLIDAHRPEFEKYVRYERATLGIETQNKRWISATNFE